MYIETLRDIDYNKGGWFDTCEADELYYIDAVNSICYVVPLEDLRDYINTHQCKYGECDDKYKRSRGILVNIDIFSILYNIRIIDINSMDCPF